jgi:predicted MPP superfamily phosphohydrolase
LCHHPEYRDKYLKDRSIDLILSGHAHGGQIRLLGRGLYAPGQGIFPKYTSGIHANMIISRGLSNTAGFIPRLFNPREIVYIVPK